MNRSRFFLILVGLLMFLTPGQSFAAGILQITGESGEGQLFPKVKAFRCQNGKKQSCEAPIYLNLNEATSVNEGFYFLGYENTLAPGLYEVRSNKLTQVSLIKLSVPKALSAAKSVRVYRAFEDREEQSKIYAQYFYLGRHFFRLEKETYGDFYLASTWNNDYLQRLSPSFCSAIDQQPTATAQARDACKDWNQSSDPASSRSFSLQ